MVNGREPPPEYTRGTDEEDGEGVEEGGLEGGLGREVACGGSFGRGSAQKGCGGGEVDG